MPGVLRKDLRCPVCGKSVTLVFHEWSGSRDQAAFEYHHHEDVERERQGKKPLPCIVILPYEEGLKRAIEESGAPTATH